MNYTCKMCGWQSNYNHISMVDCVNQYRAYVEELHGLLPQGKQVCLGSIDRDSTVRIWIEGPITQFGLEHVKKYVEFMQQALGPDPVPLVESEPLEEKQ